MLFVLLCLVSYIYGARHAWHQSTSICGVVRECMLLTVSCVCGFLAMFSKETGAVSLLLCAMLKLVIAWRQYTQHRCHVSTIVPRITRCAFLSIVTFIMVRFRQQIVGVLQPPAAAFSYIDNPLLYESNLMTRMLTLARYHVQYVWLLFVPTHLSYDYSFPAIPLVTSFSDTVNIWSVVLYVSIATAIVICMQRQLFIEIFALMFSAITFFPASGILITPGTVIAERVLYLPSAGWCVFISSLLYRLQQRHRRLATMIVVVVIAWYVQRCIEYSHAWSSDTTLFTSALSSQPRSAKVQYNAGVAIKDKTVRLQHFQKAVDLYPDDLLAQMGLGAAYEELFREQPTEDNVYLLDRAEQSYLFALHNVTVRDANSAMESRMKALDTFTKFMRARQQDRLMEIYMSELRVLVREREELLAEQRGMLTFR